MANKSSSQCLWGIALAILIAGILWWCTGAEYFQVSNSPMQSVAFAKVINDSGVSPLSSTVKKYDDIESGEVLHVYDGVALANALKSKLLSHYNYGHPTYESEYRVLWRMGLPRSNRYNPDSLGPALGAYLEKRCRVSRDKDTRVSVYSPCSLDMKHARVVSQNEHSCQVSQLCDLLSLLKGYY